MFKTVISAFLSLCLCAPVSAQNSDGENVFRIEPGATATINRHGVCRRVRNLTGTPAMVGTRTAAEWSVGRNSLLSVQPQHFAVMTCINFIGRSRGLRTGGSDGDGSDAGECSGVVVVYEDSRRITLSYPDNSGDNGPCEISQVVVDFIYAHVYEDFFVPEIMNEYRIIAGFPPFNVDSPSEPPDGSGN